MTPTANQVAADLLLDELADLGASVRVEGGNLHLKPLDRLTPGHAARLRDLKPEVVRAVRLAALTEGERETWDERVAICVIDGGLGEAEAEEIAWRQIDAQDAHVGARAAGAAEA
jgi:hypothetical protein